MMPANHLKGLLGLLSGPDSMGRLRFLRCFWITLTWLTSSWHGAVFIWGQGKPVYFMNIERIWKKNFDKQTRMSSLGEASSVLYCVSQNRLVFVFHHDQYYFIIYRPPPHSSDINLALTRIKTLPSEWASVRLVIYAEKKTFEWIVKYSHSIWFNVIDFGCKLRPLVYNSSGELKPCWIELLLCWWYTGEHTHSNKKINNWICNYGWGKLWSLHIFLVIEVTVIICKS